MAVVSMKELLEAGVHFGHQTRRWNPKMKRFIFDERGGIYIIDLQQTQALLQEAHDFARNVAERGGTILFVGTKKQAQDAIVREARRLNLPVVALVDTNCDPDDVAYVVPGNDDAIRSCSLVVRAIADGIAAGGSKVTEAELTAAAPAEPAPAAAAPAETAAPSEEPAASVEPAASAEPAASVEPAASEETVAEPAAEEPVAANGGPA